MSADRGLLAGGNGFIIIPAKAWLMEMKSIQVIHTPPYVRTCTYADTEMYSHAHIQICAHTQHQPYVRSCQCFVELIHAVNADSQADKQAA